MAGAWLWAAMGLATLPAQEGDGAAHSLPGPAQTPGFEVIEKREYYRVDASELRALRRQLEETRRKAGFDGKSVGLTRQSLQTHYRLEPRDGGCRLADLAVTVEVTIHLPEWLPAKPTKASLRQAWAAMMVGLTLHEEGHRDNAIAAGRELHARLAALAGDMNCLGLARAVQRESFRTQVRFQLRDGNYDRSTNHGVNQGSRL